MAAFRSDFGGTYLISELTFSLIERAMDLAEMYGLRGYDAVQLAASLDVNTERRGYGFAPLTLVSADTDRNQAAIAEGLSIENPNDHP
jgi:hypothetical protein